MAINLTGAPVSLGAGPLSLGDGRSKFDEVADPLAGVADTGDLEADAAAELDAMQQAYRARSKNEEKRKKAATDSEFWFAVCFTSREEKDEFLREHGLIQLGDKYLDGRAVDKALKSS